MAFAFNVLANVCNIEIHEKYYFFKNVYSMLVMRAMGSSAEKLSDFFEHIGSVTQGQNIAPLNNSVYLFFFALFASLLR